MIKELQEKRATIITNARKEYEKAVKEDSVNQEVEDSFSRAMADADKLKAQIENLRKLADVQAGSPIVPELDKSEKRSDYDKAFDKLCRHTRSALNPAEVRALEVGTATEGGNITSETYEKAIVKKLDEMNFMRSICKVIKTTGTHNIPYESTAAVATWVDEEGAVEDDADPAFGKAQLKAYGLKHIVKYSIELAQDSSFDLAGYVADHLGRAFGTTEETGFLVGTGGGTQPTGLFSSAGTGTTTASATALTGTELIDWYHSLTRAYRRNAVIVMNDSSVAAIRKLKDGNGQYLWVQGFGNEPDKLLGKPLYTSSAIDEIEAEAEVACIFSPDFFVIGDRGNTIVKLLDQLYAATGQYGMFCMKRVDGLLTQAEAAKKLVMHA
jgi:HK97 family phage major capsid protein